MGHLDGLRNDGQPLPAALLRQFEAGTGVDLSAVRVHADARAHHLTQALQAKAFTFGDDVVFARGQYQPSHEQGRRLLAHELAHVVQQRGHGRCVQRQTDSAQSAKDLDQERLVQLGRYIGACVDSSIDWEAFEVLEGREDPLPAIEDAIDSLRWVVERTEALRERYRRGEVAAEGQVETLAGMARLARRMIPSPYRELIQNPEGPEGDVQTLRDLECLAAYLRYQRLAEGDPLGRRLLRPRRGP